MMRRTPLKRTGFKPRTPLHKSVPNREQALMERARAAMKNVAPRAAVMGGACTGVAVPKAAPVRSEPYRRAVAGLRCIHCGVLGYSQCAHANTGKGASIKACDLQSFPLCTVHPGADGRLVQGCHENFDQGALFAKAVRRELEPVWAADTRRKIQAMGLWPKGLPVPDD